LVAGASPILIDLAAAVAATGGFEGTLGVRTFDVQEVTPFELPLLAAGVDGARSAPTLLESDVAKVA
jgi:hypothetical protein